MELKDADNWNETLFTWVERLDIVNIFIKAKRIYRFMLHLVTSHCHFYRWKKSCKIYGTIKHPRGQNYLDNEEQDGGSTLSDFKTQNKASIIKTAC